MEKEFLAPLHLPKQKALKVKINLIVRNPIYVITIIPLIVFSLQSNPGFPLVTTFLYVALSLLK